VKAQLKNFTLVIISVVLALAVFIGLFEMTASYHYDSWKAEFAESGNWYGKLAMPSNNEILKWEYRPDSAGQVMGVAIQTNKHGFRDRNHPYVKNRGDLRIAFVGDSVTLGIGVEEDDTFVRVFEREARARLSSDNVEAMSYAVDGYNAIQALELVRDRVLSFAPDIVVYVMCMNDFDFDRASGKKGKYFKKPDSFFLRVLERAYRKLSGVNYYDYFFYKNREIVFSEIMKLKPEIDARGIDFRIALVPIFSTENFQSQYAIMDTHKEIVATLADNDVAVVDLLEAFAQEVSHPFSFSIDGQHMNAKGHRRVAVHFIDALL